MKKKQNHKTPSQIIAEKNQQKRFKDIVQRLSRIPEDESYEEVDLTGKTVRLDKDKIRERMDRGELSKLYINWFNENKDNEFIVKGKDEQLKIMYQLEGVEFWVFSEFDLEIVE